MLVNIQNKQTILKAITIKINLYIYIYLKHKNKLIL